MRLNKCCSRYISVAFEHEAWVQDFFRVRFSNKEFLWCNPPLRLFWNMILNLNNCAAKGVGVFHNWAGAHYYPLFIKGGHLPNVVVDF